MRKLALALSALALAGCAQKITPADCRHTLELPHTTIQVGPHDAYSTLKPGVSHVLLRWTADGGITGGDNVYPWNSPDTIALGCQDGLSVTEANWQ